MEPHGLFVVRNLAQCTSDRGAIVKDGKLESHKLPVRSRPQFAAHESIAVLAENRRTTALGAKRTPKEWPFDRWHSCNDAVF